VFIIPCPNTIYCHHEEGARTAGRDEYVLVWIAIIFEFVENEFSKLVGCAILTEVVTNGLREKLPVKLHEQVT
jgi:hypothetical protein